MITHVYRHCRFYLSMLSLSFQCCIDLSDFIVILCHHMMMKPSVYPRRLLSYQIRRSIKKVSLLLHIRDSMSVVLPNERHKFSNLRSHDYRITWFFVIRINHINENILPHFWPVINVVWTLWPLFSLWSSIVVFTNILANHREKETRFSDFRRYSAPKTSKSRGNVFFLSREIAILRK